MNVPEDDDMRVAKHRPSKFPEVEEELQRKQRGASRSPTRDSRPALDGSKISSIAITSVKGFGSVLTSPSVQRAAWAPLISAKVATRASSLLSTLHLSPGPRRSLDAARPPQRMAMMTWSLKTIRISILPRTISPWQDPPALRRCHLLPTIPFRPYGPCKSPCLRTTPRSHLIRRLHTTTCFLISRSHPKKTSLTLPSPMYTRVLSNFRPSSISNRSRKSPCPRMETPPRHIPMQSLYTNRLLQSRVEIPFPTSRRQKMLSIKGMLAQIKYALFQAASGIPFVRERR
ncbi:hypothetical protein L210DRAFT_3156917 [Boletus edulis BED1]|uniref:Uncharacterized protein n=1 Tax=Boletus edulis BED1 TaxID=1328754 RepID=A0AAD4BXZ2_BOLED|nr:hypothetical protein L210DRAFT_3156917 [Boletus edulis BED1]